MYAVMKKGDRKCPSKFCFQGLPTSVVAFSL